MNWWQVLAGIVAAVLMLWLGLIAALWLSQRRNGDSASWRDSMRFLPEVLILVKHLATDETLPRGVRVRLYLLIGYLLLPIDLVPDFLPVIGYADDAFIVALVLRSVVRTAGPQAIDKHWPGSRPGLNAVYRLAGLPQG